MLQRWIPLIFMAVSVIAAFGIARYFKDQPMHPALCQARSRRWTVFVVSMLACGYFMFTLWTTPILPQYRWFMALMLAGIVLSSARVLYPLLRSPGDREWMSHYAVDTAHCGRCGYDLTANISGTCPECGWTIPTEPPEIDVDSPGWWRRWRIEHLRRWPLTLASLLVRWAITMALAVAVLIYLRLAVYAVIIGLLAVPSSINIVRVAWYGWNKTKLAGAT
jgi:hypothetical protein